MPDYLNSLNTIPLSIQHAAQPDPSSRIDQVLTAIAEGAPLDTHLGSLGLSLRECLEHAGASGHEDELELLMNCAGGSGEIARFARSLLLKSMAPSQTGGFTAQDRARTIRGMAQDLICSWWSAEKKPASGATPDQQAPRLLPVTRPEHQPEILLMAASALPDEGKDLSLPPVVADAVTRFDEGSPWKPVWWHDAPPSNEGVFSPAALQKMLSSPNSMMRRIYSAQGDGACLFRSCLAITDRDTRWLHAKGKDDILAALKARGWDDMIKAAIQQALDILASPSENIREGVDADTIYAETIANGKFNLWSAHGLTNLLQVAPQRASEDDLEFLQTLSDAIYDAFIASVRIPVAGMTRDQAPEAVLLLKNNHYDVRATDGFFPDA